MQKHWKTFCLNSQIPMHYFISLEGTRSARKIKHLMLLNSFFLDLCNPLHCQRFHFNQWYLALLHNPSRAGLVAMLSAFLLFWDAAQEQSQFAPKSLLASFSSTEEREIAFNGNFEKALQHLSLWNSIYCNTIFHYALKRSGLKLLSQTLFFSVPTTLSKALVWSLTWCQCPFPEKRES